MPTEELERIHGLDFLRGVASLAVCWAHLTSYIFVTPDGRLFEAVRHVFNQGWLGVEVFFVISGFVIPYSLHRAGYRVGDYPAFIARRLVRLDPPYLVSIAFVLALAYGYALFKGIEPRVDSAPVDAARVLLHLGYLNVAFGYEWLNPAFWTLALEFQYYLLVGLAFPVFVTRRAWARRLAFACCAAAALLADPTLYEGGAPYSNFILRFVPLFLLGAATFQHRARIVGRAEYALLLLLSGGVSFYTVGWRAAAAALFAVAVINLYDRRTALADFFGRISYSLYLLHWPVGSLVLSLVGQKLLGVTSDASKIFVVCIGFVACVAAAWALYAAVERPAQRWASRFGYGRRRAAVAASGLTPADTPNAPAGVALTAEAEANP
jgi:peptidoglycan/LPS O-acetylase OafA/YrhL